MRTSVNDPYSTPETAMTGSVGDYEAVNDAPSIATSLIYLGLKIFTAICLIIGIGALILPYLFPQWADRNKNALSELSIATDTKRFVSNAKSVDWRSAFTWANFRNLALVGTGRHSYLKANPGLREGAWYTGQGFIMKNYVREYDMLIYDGDIAPSSEIIGEMGLPATNIEQGKAFEYCQSKGGRLPTWEEISLAYYFAATKEWQKKVGDFLRPNLRFDINSKYSLWTSTAEGDGYLTSDNFQIFTPGQHGAGSFKDNGYESDDLSFVCFMPEPP